MFNLLISGNSESWNTNPYELSKSRVAIEYTADQISERYKSLDARAIEELKSFPSLFVIENEEIESKVGYITDIRIRQKTIVFNFEFDPIFPPLPIGVIESLRTDIDLGRWELSRTHWAVKDEPLLEILLQKGHITSQQFDASQAIREQEANEPELVLTAPGEFNTSQVFIVHGHDDLIKLEMKAYIEELGFEPIILHMQASSGRTIIEKIEHYSNVGFAVVLYTPCDVGSKVGELTGSYRARQNVVFEHGYLIGKLGRSRVVAVVKGQIETPNDISGVVYVSMNNSDSCVIPPFITEVKSRG